MKTPGKADFWKLVWFHRWFAVAVLFCAMIAIGAVAFITPKVYRVDAELLVEPASNMVVESAARARDSDERLLNNQVEILRSDAMASQVLQALKQKPVQGLQISKAMLQNALTVHHKPGTNVLALRLVSEGTPQALRQVLQTYVNTYVSALQRMSLAKARGEREFLEKQLEKAEVLMAQQAQEIRDFQAQSQIYNLDSQIDHMLDQQTRLDEQLQLLGGEIAALGSQTRKQGTVLSQEDAAKRQLALDTLRAKRSSVLAEAALVGAALDNVPDRQLALVDLKSRFDLAQERVRALQKRLDEAALREDVSSHLTKVEVLRQPVVTISSLPGGLQENLPIALLLGFAVALLAVLVRAAADNILRWPSQVMSLLGGGGNGQAVFTLANMPNKTAFRKLLEKSHVVVPESYKRFILQLENISTARQVRRIGVMPISPSPEAGMALGLLGLYLTELGNKIVLIDTDLTDSSLSHLVGSLKLPISGGILQGPGLSEYLQGDVEDFVDVIYPLGKTVYGSFIPVGAGSGGKQPRFSHKSLSRLEANLSPNYHFVLYGLPPVEASYDAMAVARGLDGVFLLLEPGKTTLGQVRNTLDELKNTNCKVLGVLLQGV